MEYRRLGGSGLKVSALGLGSWVTFGDQLDDDPVYECMKVAIEHGVNLLDNAEYYAHGQAEELMGKALRRGGWRRSSLVITTKIFWGGDGPNDTGLSRKHLLEGTAASLERLGLEYVDLLFCHRPDHETPIEETVRAMDHLVNTGKALYWGTSEWSPEQVREAHGVARREHLIPPTMEQPQYNMFHRERVEQGLAPLAADLGLGLTTWSPLSSGLLSGKYDDGIPAGSRVTLPGYEWLREIYQSPAGQARIAATRELKPIAEELGCTRAQLAIAWCLRRPEVSCVLTGASRPEQVVENLKALEVVPRLDEAAQARIEGVLAAAAAAS